MQAFFFPPQWAPEWSIYPEMCSAGPPLPTILIASDVLDSVQLTSKETRCIIVPRGTSGDQTYTGSVCSHQQNPSLATSAVVLSCLAQCQSIRFSHFNQEKRSHGHASQTNWHASAALFPYAPQNPQLVHYFLPLC